MTNPSDLIRETTRLNNMAAVYFNLGDLELALETFLQVLPLVREVGDQDGEATALNNIGEVYRRQGDADAALHAYEEAILLWRNLGDISNEATVLNNVGMVYRQLGDNGEALAHYQRALAVWKRGGNPYRESITHTNIAVTLWDMGNAEQALAHMQTARNINERMGLSTAEEDAKLLEWWGQEVNLESYASHIVGFINTDNWDEGEAYVSAHRATLLHPATEAAFIYLINHQSDEGVINILRAHQWVLRWCQETSIPQAFARAREQFRPNTSE